jgi:hypothetical protein
MTYREICQKLIEAVNAAIANSSDVAAALRSLEFAGVELDSLRIQANLKTSREPADQSDSEFLRTLRIVPDLNVHDTFR